jgi:uncharacterized protein (TIGR02145 family)
LTINTQYYVRAYATTSLGTTYGTQHAFMTTGLPVVASTTTVTNITATTASSGGNITSDGGGAITARGVVWSTTTNPTISNSKTTDAGTTGSFTSSLTGLTAGTLYYVRAYATNNSGTAYGLQITFTTKSLPIVSTTTVTSITSTTATSGGNLTNDGGLTITAKGVCWSTSPNPTIANSKTDNGVTAGTYASNLTGLSPSTLYYVRAYATNTAGTAYGTQISFTTEGLNTVVTGTGKTWQNKNLGATQVATSQFDANALGDLYQWGRGTDGHEKRTSSTTVVQSSGNVPGNAFFIRGGSSGNFDNPYDWRVTPNNNLWQGVSGINNPCPAGFRIPTQSEWEAEIATWATRNAEGAFASPLKLPIGGDRDSQMGSISNVATTSINGIGFYWSSTNSTSAPGVSMSLQLRPKQPNNSADVGQAVMTGYARANGNSVRCIQN